MGSSICLNCSTSACTIAELQQQLADARLLARAYMLGVLEDFDAERVVLRDDDRAELVSIERDPDGLPILTDEVRAALRKAVGE